MQKIMIILGVLLFSLPSIAQEADPKLKDINDEVNSALYCFSKSSKLCQHFKTFTGIEFIEHEGVSLDEKSIIIAAREETIKKRTPKITKSNDKNLILMSILFKEPFLNFLKLNVKGVDNLILVVRDAQGKVTQGVKINYEMFIYMDPEDIIKSVNLALIYGNDRFYKMFITPTLL